MPLTVEDGSNVPNANSYASVAYADAYFEERGNTAWGDLDDEVKEASLILATDYIRIRFGHRFIGTPEYTTQYLDWPRTGWYSLRGVKTAVPSGIPDAIKRATVEYAYRTRSAPLLEDPADSNGVVTRLREKVGPLETETFWDKKSGALGIRQYPYVDLMLRDLLLSASLYNGGVVRA